MIVSDYISIGSVVVSVSAFLYTYFSNTKKYELTSQYRSEVISWFDDTTKILMDLKHQCYLEFPNEEIKISLLSALSSKIELGRFYFPNINKSDSFGDDKPLAYRGYRNLILDFLVFSYRLYKKNNAQNYLTHADTLQRYFTSYVFEVIDPIKFLKDTERNTNQLFSKDLSFEDFLIIDPELIKTYIHDS
ncbi:MAG: hypothetical protein EOP42_12540 [Sphingobacteriaceae bacterium]|nr:MAG: hypothetical protein EOP42_12540 [Sphingobacteriaceae bacterium]